MGNEVCCKAEEQQRPQVKPFLVCCESENFKLLSPPESLHDLRSCIKDQFSLEPGDYEIRGTLMEQISTDESYVKEVSQ
jgi:hypothetical protein